MKVGGWTQHDSASPPALGDREVHCWLVPFAPRAGDEGILDADEAARAARFHFDRDRMRFISGRAWVRRLLGAYCGAEPQSLVFTVSEHGKPALDHAGAPAFNFSRSGDWGLLAISGAGPIGADIEALIAIADAEAVARDNFSQSEQVKLRAASGALRNDVFYRIWTRKEAVVKALGQGLTAPLNAFSVSANDADAAVLDAEAAAWEVRSLQLTALAADGLVGAIATPFSPRAVLKFIAGEAPERG